MNVARAILAWIVFVLTLMTSSVLVARALWIDDDGCDGSAGGVIIVVVVVVVVARVVFGVVASTRARPGKSGENKESV